MTRRIDRERTADAGVAATLLDLVLVGVLAVAALGFAAAADPSATLASVRVVLGALLVFVLPGYALTAALFPAVALESSPDEVPPPAEYAAVSPTERAVLAVGLSLATTPLVVLALNFTPFGIEFASVLNGICAVVLVGVVVAAARRMRLPPHRRFRLSYSRFAGETSGNTGGISSIGSTSRVDRIRALPVAYFVVAVFLVASVGLVGATLADPQNGERYTEFYLLTGNGENGTLVADEYPETFGANGTASLYVGIENRESRTVEYTVVTELQRIETVDGERRVTAESQLDRFSTTLAAGETFRQQRQLAADSSVTGQRLRLIFLLYKGDVPASPTEANAYRETHIWINSTAGGAQA